MLKTVKRGLDGAGMSVYVADFEDFGGPDPPCCTKTYQTKILKD